MSELNSKSEIKIVTTGQNSARMTVGQKPKESSFSKNIKKKILLN
jgi:hypothetical protein